MSEEKTEYVVTPEELRNGDYDTLKDVKKKMSEKEVKCPNCGCKVKSDVNFEKMLVGCPNDNCSVSLFFAGEGGIVNEKNVTGV